MFVLLKRLHHPEESFSYILNQHLLLNRFKYVFFKIAVMGEKYSDAFEHNSLFCATLTEILFEMTTYAKIDLGPLRLNYNYLKQ